MPPAPHDDLPIFVQWTTFLAWLLPTTEKFPHKIRFTFSNRIDNLALDLVDDLVEARYARDKRAILARANLRLEKLRVLLRLCHTLGYLAHSRYEHAMRSLNDVGQMLGGWRRQQEGAMKRHGHLFDRIIAFDHLLQAAQRAQRGKRHRHSVAAFLFHLEPAVLALQEALRTGTYRMQPYHTFTIYEPKRRQICAAAFCDRVVHHALCAVLDPLFDARLITHTYACRRGKGTLAAITHAQHCARRWPYVLTCDIQHYFETVDHAVLKTLLRRTLKDPAVLALLDHIIDHPLPGSPPGTGLPIGNLTSQYFANLYLGELDHLLCDRLGCQGYVRYMDDFLVFADDKPRLWALLETIRQFLHTTLRLTLKKTVVRVIPVTQGINFLGVRVFPGALRVQHKSWTRLQRRVRWREKQYVCGRISEETLAQSVQSMLSHVQHAGVLTARRRLFTASKSLG